MTDLVLEFVEPSTLVPYAKNARTHSASQVTSIARSIQSFGFLNPIIVDGNMGIVAGHGRLLAAAELGLDRVPIIRADSLTEEQRRAYVIADNKLAELAGWDDEILQEELRALADGGFALDLLGFDAGELLELLDGDLGGGLADPDLVPDRKDYSISHSGDLWVCGPHRVLCGDSTREESLAALCAGESVDMLLTDPPYNVDYTGKTADALKIKNDVMNQTSFQTFLTAAFGSARSVMRPGAAFYVWGPSLAFDFWVALQNVGMVPRQTLIWVKDRFVMGRSDYHHRHEACIAGQMEHGAGVQTAGVEYGAPDDEAEETPGDEASKDPENPRCFEMCTYGWTEGAAHFWRGGRKQSTVLEFKRPASNTEHPTMKPASLFKYQIENNTRSGEVVLDCFGGSGTTLIACESSQRIARICELDPVYVDVIVRRWQEYTGKSAHRLADGASFDDVERQVVMAKTTQGGEA